MKYKAYRLCLLSFVIIALIGGIFYYYTATGKNTRELDGTFVEQILNENLIVDRYTDAFTRLQTVQPVQEDEHL